MLENSALEFRLEQKLDQRRVESSLRTLNLTSANHSVDFSSNDYLGLAHSSKQHGIVESKYRELTQKQSPPFLGSTGSRLLSGNSAYALSLEKFLAVAHNRPCALLCNSGYDANLSILSSIALPDDFIVLDELVHNSLIMGIKMSRIPMNHVNFFRHNDVQDLERILLSLKGRSGGDDVKGCTMVIVESVYSMDGDVSPLEEILDLSSKFGANVVVDEAHGLGVFGRTNVNDLSINTSLKTVHSDSLIGGTGVLSALNLENHPALLAAVYTFGKAAGCHGAVITGSKVLIEYLINYARPFVYSTSLPSHSLVAIKCSYDTFIGIEGERLRSKVFHLVHFFRSNIETALKDESADYLLPSPSPIQAIICRGNEHCVEVAKELKELGGISVFPIRSPTVPKGEERIRIILHEHNTEMEVVHLVKCILRFMKTSNANIGKLQGEDMTSKL